MQIINRFYTVVKPFWFCRGAAVNWRLLASAVGTTLGIVWITVQYTYWSRTFYDAMGDFFAQASPSRDPMYWPAALCITSSGR